MEFLRSFLEEQVQEPIDKTLYRSKLQPTRIVVRYKNAVYLFTSLNVEIDSLDSPQLQCVKSALTPPNTAGPQSPPLILHKYRRIFEEPLSYLHLQYSPGKTTDQLFAIVARLRQQIRQDWKSMRRSFRVSGGISPNLILI